MFENSVPYHCHRGTGEEAPPESKAIFLRRRRPKRQPPNVSSGETPLSMNGCTHGLWPTTFRFFRLSRRLPTSNCHSHLVSFSTAEPRPGRISSPSVADVHTLSFRWRPPSSKSLWTGKQDREGERATGGGVGATPRGHWRKRVGVEKGGKRTRWASFLSCL